MANKQSPAKPPGTLEQLNVRVPTELLRRVSAVAGAKGETLAKFVIETLDIRTKEHQADVQRIAEREKSPRKWQQ